MSRHLVIAVDGPAASGKSTLARRLADHFALPFLDTGLLYRAVARAMLDRGRDFEDTPAALAVAQLLTAEEVQPERVRGEGVGQGASIVAAVPAVRTALLPFQRRFAGRQPGAVLAGRDVGTVICPDAAFKLFVTASDEERARRRHEELRRRGERPMYAAVLAELRERDRRDAERAVAPMRIPAGAFVLDTTPLDADAAFEAARQYIDDGRAGADASTLD